MTENEKKKEYLNRYKQAVSQLKRIEWKIRELRLNKMCPSVVSDGMPHANNISDLSTYAAELDAQEREYISARYEKIKVCKEISDQIEFMADENEKNVLFSRYIKLEKWEDICVGLGYSWKHVHRIHSKALYNFKEDIE